MHDRSAARDRCGSLLDPRRDGSVARYIALERQKQELRSERDALLIAVARDVGEEGVAERLQLAPEVAAKLLAGARGRAGAEALDETIVPARLAAGSSRRAQADSRWTEVDAYYEALGCGQPSRFARRSARPS
jgi:hypothetical protein